MGRHISDLGSPEFTALFTGFKHTAYRLETLQHYGVGYEDESFRAFASGNPPVTDPARDEWTAMIRSAVANGKTFQRVHVVEEPLSEYLRYAGTIVRHAYWRDAAMHHAIPYTDYVCPKLFPAGGTRIGDSPVNPEAES